MFVCFRGGLRERGATHERIAGPVAGAMLFIALEHALGGLSEFWHVYLGAAIYGAIFGAIIGFIIVPLRMALMSGELPPGMAVGISSTSSADPVCSLVVVPTATS